MRSKGCEPREGMLAAAMNRLSPALMGARIAVLPPA